MFQATMLDIFVSFCCYLMINDTRKRYGIIMQTIIWYIIPTLFSFSVFLGLQNLFKVYPKNLRASLDLPVLRPLQNCFIERKSLRKLEFWDKLLDSACSADPLALKIATTVKATFRKHDYFMIYNRICWKSL